VQPLFAEYLGRLESRVRDLAPGAPLRIMVSSGGFTSGQAAAETPILLLESGPAGGVLSALNTARNNGDWLGTSGLTSSSARTNAAHNTTLGAMEGTDYTAIYGAGATFDGETFDSTAILIKYTYYGDTDFNGKVNFDDYVRTDSGFNNHKSGWVNGDFDGNGQVNFDDYVLIDLAFNTQSGTL